MPLKPRITFRNMDVSETLEQDIRARIAEAEQICNRITACNVVVEAHRRHPSGGQSFHVGVELAVPGRTIVVRRGPPTPHGHEDAYLAVRNAFDAARRQLEDHLRMARGEVKTHAAPARGA
jgi:ribosome-associated translation inhibitor RaiA